MGNTHSQMAVDDYQHAAYKATDDRGRITLGNEFADSTVAVAWVEVEEPEPADVSEPSDAEKEKLGELWQWAQENDYTPLDFDVEGGRVYTGGAEWVDADVAGLDTDG